MVTFGHLRRKAVKEDTHCIILRMNPFQCFNTARNFNPDPPILINILDMHFRTFNWDSSMVEIEVFCFFISPLG